MTTETDTAEAEVRKLRTCISDLLSISAIASISRGRDVHHVIGTLLEVLVGALHLDFAHAECYSLSGGVPVVLSRLPNRPAPSDLTPELRAAVDGWWENRDRAHLSVGRYESGDGELSFALASLGYHEPIGWLLVSSSREGFPTQIERLLIGVAANQVAITAQQAELLSQQTYLSRELEQKVAQRTKQLQQANTELEGALKQVDALRDELHRENLELREKVAKIHGGLATWQLKRAETLMGDNLSVQIPLSQLAELCGLSVRHFTRAFRQSTGLPPHRWLLGRRVERAKELLPDSTLSLAAIALTCGFGSQSHFTRIFTAAEGMSPGLWRRLRSAS